VAQTGATGGMLGMALLDRPVHNFEDARAANHDLFAKFFWQMLDRGVWLPPSGYESMFISAAHDESVLERVIEAAGEAFGAASHQ
jgi:glutamate-1-semialdehyde 2,1-aminomutase